MNNIYLSQAYPNELYHWGIKGQRWGVRRFQNPDGSLTPAGRKRYYNSDGTLTKKGVKEFTQPKATAMEAIDGLKKNGFRDDNTSDPKDHWLSKNIKTKHGEVEFFTNIDTTKFGMKGGTGSHPINPSDMKTAVQGVNKHGSAAISRISKELRSEIKSGHFGSSDIELGNIESVYVVEFRDKGTISCEISAPVKDKTTGNTFGWFSIELDPTTGSFKRISYND